MSSPTLRLPGSVAEIEASPRGPSIAAFFDLDGTLIAGYSARFLGSERMRNRELSLSELVRTIGVAVGAGIGRAGFEDLLKLGAEAWRGRAHEDLEEMGQRLFQRRVERVIYPEMRELVRAHQRRGHTVVLTSSATSYQVEPVARFLGIDRVLCNRFSVKDGLLTGGVERPTLWGPTKADAVQKLSADLGIDAHLSYFYADGDEDLALMYLVGHPRPTNPGKRLARVAAARGWPVLRFSSRGGGGLGAPIKMLAGLAALPPVAALGVATGIVKRDKHAVMNTTACRWIDLTFAINGVKLNVIGRENLWEQRPAVFIFNHRNQFDAFIVARLIDRDWTGVAKKEMAEAPITGPITAALGKLADVAFIDRSDRTSAVAGLQAIQEVAKKGLSVLIAPEGTRLDTTEVGPFKKGAFRMAMAAAIPIVPIVIRNAELIASRDGNSLHPGTVDVVVLPPISVDDWTLEDLDSRIESVRQRYIDTLRHWPEPV
jgi:putative phosphoserine phosphatase/1-acylglycerol-3-phosphate O-acyltransferase